MAEEHARWKQYEYAANSNLVLTSERRSRDNEPSVRCHQRPAPAPRPASSSAVSVHGLRTSSSVGFSTHLLQCSHAPLSNPSFTVLCECEGGAWTQNPANPLGCTS